MTRPAQVVIDLKALRHNYSRVRSLAPNSRVISVVKADAYGHGLTRIAQTLKESDAFGVACIDEAMELREAGIDQAIILLEGPYSADELADIERLKLDIVVHHQQQVEMLEKVDIQSPVKIWLKIDSGMHRLGFDVAELDLIWKRLSACNKVDQDIALMTHLANASDPDSDMSLRQLAIFNEACENLTGSRTVANSAATIAFPETHADYVRPGLMLYGISPMDNCTATDHDLQPVMSLQSELISIKTVNKGETVGYGADWICPQTMPVGIVAAGYGDGFPRHAKSGTPIMVNETRCQVIGNPSMDMITVDLRNQANARVGDAVELWGKKLPVEEVASHAGTIAYELVTGVHKRLKVRIHE